MTGSDELPWVIARDAGNLKETGAGLCVDAGRRVDLRRDSRAWMERHWSETVIAARLSEVYGAY